MDFNWLAIALGDVEWIALAFGLGFLSKLVGLPPLVGFLATGFILNGQGVVTGESLEKLADLGITLLLFTVGLKINIKNLIKPEVWAVTGIHVSVIVIAFGFAIYALALLGLPYIAGLDLNSSLLIAFALSFSSTVLVVKVLEDKGEMKSLHGRIAIGILIIQDIVAVVFLAISTGKMPSIWALLLFGLIPMRFLLLLILQRVGRGELLVLYGFILAMGGAELFELVEMKGDLGALILGVLIATHPKSDEMSKIMLGFKDLFLLGFFVSIGLSGQLTLETFMIGALITPLIFVKSVLFFGLLIGFKLRARTALLSTLNLTNYSEFGLIVMAIGVGNNWIHSDWLIIISIAMSLSFVISALFNSNANELYDRYRVKWRSLQRQQRLADDKLLDVGEATIAIIGMGSVGTGSYDKMKKTFPYKIVGIDIDPVVVKKHYSENRHVIVGDPSDADFWDRIQEKHVLNTVMLTLPKFSTTLAVLHQLKNSPFQGQIAATSKYPDQAEILKQKGVMVVSNIYTEAGAGFASHVTEIINN